MARKRRALFSSFPGDESIFFPSSLVKNSPRRICRDAGVPPANGNDLDNENPFLSDGTQVSVPTSMPFCYYASRSPPKRYRQVLVGRRRMALRLWQGVCSVRFIGIANPLRTGERCEEATLSGQQAVSEWAHCFVPGRKWERTFVYQKSESAPFTPKYPMNCSFRQGPSYTIVGLIKRESGIDKEHTVFVPRRLQSGM